MQDFQVVYRFSVFEFIPVSGVLRRNGGKVQLYFQAAQVLTTLLESAGKLVTRQQLESVLWPNGDSGDHERGVNRIVSYLRTALSDNPRKPRFIETLPKRGYRFCGSVQSIPEFDPKPSAPYALEVVRKQALLPSAEIQPQHLELASAAGALEPATMLPQRILPLPLRQMRGWVVGVGLAMVFLLFGGLLRIKLRPVHGQIVALPQPVVVMVLPNTGTALAPEALQFQAQLVDDLKQLPHIEVRTSEYQNLSSPSFAPAEYQARRKSGDKQEAPQPSPLYLIVKLVPVGTGYHLSLSTVRDGDALDGGQDYEISRQQMPLIHKFVANRFYKAYSRSPRSPATLGKPTDDLAYPMYLRSLPLIQSRTEESLKQAVEMLKTATARDPGFAAAKARLALAMMLRTTYHWSSDDPGYRQTRRLAEESIALDPDTSEAHEVLGYLAMYQDWNFERAEQELRNSLELNGFDVQSRIWLAILLSYEGAGAESLEQLHTAQLQDPESRCLMHNEVLLLSNAGRLPEMLAAAKKAARLFPDDPNIQDQYGWALWYNHEYLDAVQAWITKARLQHDSNVEHFETAALAVLRSHGVPAYAELKIAALRQGKLSDLKQDDAGLAQWYLYANQPDQALTALEQGFQRRDSTLLLVKADPVYVSLHGKERYENLLAKMHLDRELTPYTTSLELASVPPSHTP